MVKKEKTKKSINYKNQSIKANKLLKIIKDKLKKRKYK